MKWPFPIALFLIFATELVPSVVNAECICQGSLGMQCRGNVSANHMSNCKMARRLILTSAVLENCLLPWHAFPYLRSIDLIAESQYCRCLSIDCSHIPAPIVVYGCTNACLKLRDAKDYARQMRFHSNAIVTRHTRRATLSGDATTAITPNMSTGPAPFITKPELIYPEWWFRRNRPSTNMVERAQCGCCA